LEQVLERAQVPEREPVLAQVQGPAREPVQGLEQGLAQEPARGRAPEQVRALEHERRMAPKRGRAQGAAFTRHPGTSASDLGRSTLRRMTLGIRRIRGWKQ
jgi:hypothetical protein